MAQAGERYQERTGNIWSYAHRGDMTGVKAAILRGVDVNMPNTVGWTACHAAAAGGQTKALRYLVKTCGADLEIADRSGGLAVHQAAKNGHVQVLKAMQQEMGVDLTRVRLSQAKGKVVKDLLMEAYRKQGKEQTTEDSDEEAVVGYSRKQSKSTAFWGPRKTPSSGRIKKKILKQRRQRKKDKREEETELSINNDANGKDKELIGTTTEDETSNSSSELGYVETVQKVKRARKRPKPKGKNGTTRFPHPRLIPDSGEDDMFLLGGGNLAEEGASEGSELETDAEDNSMHIPASRFSALTLQGDSDSEGE